MRTYRGLCLTLVAVLCAALPLSAQEPDDVASLVAADVIASILENGDEGAIQTADTPSESLAAPVLGQGVESEEGTQGGVRALAPLRSTWPELSARISYLFGSLERTVGVALGLILLVSALVLILRASRGTRVAEVTVREEPQKVVRLPRKLRRNPSIRYSRDAERLALHLRTRDAA